MQNGSRSKPPHRRDQTAVHLGYAQNELAQRTAIDSVGEPSSVSSASEILLRRRICDPTLEPELAVVERALDCGQLRRMTNLSLYDDPILYDRVVRPGPCEAFYRDLARQTGGPILELACGTGRVTLPLARDGHEVVGLDASPAMLQATQDKADAECVEIAFVQQDMRAFDLGRRFPLIILCCNSLAHLTTNEDVKVGLGLRAQASRAGRPVRL